MKKLTMALLLALAAIGIYSCNSSSANPPKEKTEKKESTVTDIKKEANTWTYDSSVNDMGDKITQATVLANELAHFDFPYNGGSQADLTVRKKNNKTDVMFYIDKGQIDTDYDGTYVRVKFDDGEPTKWLVNEASSGSSNIVFIDNVKSFLSKLKSSKKIVIEVPFYQSGNHQFVFNSENIVL